MPPSQAHELTLTVTRSPQESSGSPHVVALSGRLDASSQAAAERFLEELVASGARRVVLDCSDLEFLSSAGVRAILILVKRLKPLNGAVSMSATRPHVRQLLEFSGLRALLAITSTVEEGCAALSR